jgi:hypothetical protein
MQNVPEIVRQRLEAATPSADHPDANALTAFAERSLGQDERAFVLEHLARCSVCRDIVALALPAMEPVETAWRPAATGWLTWPALRWGFVAAGIVAITGLGVVEYQRRPATTASPAGARVEVAGNESTQAKDPSLASPVYPVTTKKAANIQAPAPYALTDAAGATEATLSEKKSTLRAIPPPAPAPQQQAGSPHGTVVGGALTHGPRMPNQWQQQSPVQTQAVAAAPSSPFANQQAAGTLSANMHVPAVPETVAVEAQSTQLETQSQNLDARQIDERQLNARPGASQQSGEDYAMARVGKAKPAEAAPDANSGPVANRVATPAVPQATGGAVLASSAPVPRWTINSSGGLERSLDQGTTWQVINVNANPVYFTAATSVRSTSRTKVQKDAVPVFRAVAASGVDVWAGGTGGALYHSQDAGDHWTRVVPTSSRAILTGDIISLEFSDMEHGKVSTSNAEVWTTTDNGQTWQKQ